MYPHPPGRPHPYNPRQIPLTPLFAGGNSPSLLFWGEVEAEDSAISEAHDSEELWGWRGVGARGSGSGRDPGSCRGSGVPGRGVGGLGGRGWGLEGAP